MDADGTAAQPGYPEPPAVGDEASTLLGSLERQRATFGWKCSGLDREQLSRRLGASELNLGKLLKHLAYMEDINFTWDLAGRTLPQPWRDVGAAGRSQWVFASADADSPETLYRLWHDAVERSRSAVTDVLRSGGIHGTYRSQGSEETSVRRLLVDMIDEYGRHTGHADLLREAIDGRVGEDPPGSGIPFTVDL
jgi:hypothetical protein